MLAKLASSGKGGRQRTVIQETLKTHRTTTNNIAEVQQINTSEGVRRSHRSLTHEMVKTPRISVYWLLGNVVAGLPSGNMRNFDDTLPMLFG